MLWIALWVTIGLYLASEIAMSFLKRSKTATIREPRTGNRNQPQITQTPEDSSAGSGNGNDQSAKSAVQVQSPESRDQGSGRLIWIAVTLGVIAAVAVQWIPFTRLHWPDRIVRPAALAFMLVGLTIRWWAIITLGRYFTTDVATQQRQPVVQTGPYRFVRHPSYSGALVAFLGIGVVMSDWLSIIVLLVPITLAIFNRIKIEERALLAALGAPYADYCSGTKRLIPGIL